MSRATAAASIGNAAAANVIVAAENIVRIVCKRAKMTTIHPVSAVIDIEDSLL